MNIFVGNLSFEAKEVDVQQAFVGFGTVASVVIVKEKKGKKSRGFGFVEMPDETEALAAIAQLQGKEILGRPINVMPALSKEPKSHSTGKKKPGDVSIFPERSMRKIETSPGFKRTGKYREGRRTLSYMKKRLDSGAGAVVSKRKYKPNPLRWRKKSQERRQPNFKKRSGPSGRRR